MYYQKHADNELDNIKAFFSCSQIELTNFGFWNKGEISQNKGYAMCKIIWACNTSDSTAQRKLHLVKGGIRYLKILFVT